MTLKDIFIITGFPGSGKGTATQYLKEKYNAVTYRFSDPLHEILSELHVQNTRKNLSKLSLLLRQKFGESIMGRGVRDFTLRNPEQLIILEGVRRIEALTEFQNLVGHIIWIDAPIQLRYNRILQRGEKAGETTLSYNDFLKQENGETELSLNSLREIADIVIENNGTEQELEEKMDIILKSLSKR